MSGLQSLKGLPCAIKELGRGVVIRSSLPQNLRHHKGPTEAFQVAAQAGVPGHHAIARQQMQVRTGADQPLRLGQDEQIPGPP